MTTSSLPALSRTETFARTDAHRDQPVGESAHSARLAAVVEMIHNLTGREVKLVPPTAYLVSAPVQAAPVELVVPNEITVPQPPAGAPLELDISNVLRTGTSSRMTLGQNQAGGLMLLAAVDVDL